MSDSKSRFDSKPWLILGGLCLLFKLSSAYFVYGPQALDDYLNTLLRVKFWLAGENLHLAPWRSPLIIWILGGVVKFLEFFGGEFSPVNRIRVVYAFLGVFSMIGPIGAWLYYRKKSESRFQYWAVMLVAFHGLVPFISTRALGEAMALALMLLGVGLCEAASLKNRSFAFWGFLSMGLATLLRFQCGVFYVPYAVLYLWRHRSAVKFFAAASLATLGIQSLIDVSIHRYPLETVFNYLLKNKDTTAYSVQPWWSTWATWAVFLFLPFSAVFFSNFKKFWERHRSVIGATFFFLLVHSLIPHKEERFLYPVLGVSLVLLAWFLGQSPFRDWSLPRQSTFVFLSMLNAVLLVIASFQNTQVGVVEPLARVSSRYKNVILFDRGSPIAESKIWTLFLSPPSTLVRLDEFDPRLLDATFGIAEGPEAAVFATSIPSRRPELERLSRWQSKDYQCSTPVEATSWTDRAVYRLNPRRNARRRPTIWVVCSRKSESNL